MKLILLLNLLALMSCLEWFEEGNPVFMQESEFDTFVKKPRHYKVIKFFTPWCIYCKWLKVTFDAIKQELKNTRKDIEFYEVNCHTNQNLCFRLGAYSFPFTIITDSQGNIRDRLIGMQPPDPVRNFILNSANPQFKQQQVPSIPNPITEDNKTINEEVKPTVQIKIDEIKVEKAEQVKLKQLVKQQVSDKPSQTPKKQEQPIKNNEVIVQIKKEAAQVAPQIQKKIQEINVVKVEEVKLEQLVKKQVVDKPSEVTLKKQESPIQQPIKKSENIVQQKKEVVQIQVVQQVKQTKPKVQQSQAKQSEVQSTIQKTQKKLLEEKIKNFNEKQFDKDQEKLLSVETKQTIEIEQKQIRQQKKISLQSQSQKHLQGDFKTIAYVVIGVIVGFYLKSVLTKENNE